MRLNRSTNPVIARVHREQQEGYGTNAHPFEMQQTATFGGIATKTGILLAVIVGITAIIWTQFDALSGILFPLLIASSIGGFIFILLAHMTRAKALFTVLYAVSQGVIIGTLTLVVQAALPDIPIVFHAAIITFIIVGFLLVAYSTGLFKVGMTFRKIVYTALFTVFIASIGMSILRLFGVDLFGGLSLGAMLGITLLMIILASFLLLIDFDNSKRAVDAGVPKEYEWVLSLGILVSLIWLYIQVLRFLLLLLARSRD